MKRNGALNKAAEWSHHSLETAPCLYSACTWVIKLKFGFHTASFQFKTSVMLSLGLSALLYKQLLVNYQRHINYVGA